MNDDGPSASGGAGLPGATGSGGAVPAVNWERPQTQSEIPVPGAQGWVFAGVGARLAAWLVDTLIVSLPIVAVSFLVVLLPAERWYGVSVVATLAELALAFVYFVAFWRSKRRATPGMRLVRIQIGNAFDGNRLTAGQATRRWIALGYPLNLLSLVPPVAGVAGLLVLLYDIVLLLTTASSPTRQGLHDRFANTAVVKPAGAASNSVLVGCLAIVVWLIGLVILGLVVVAASGDAFEGVLSQIGESI